MKIERGKSKETKEFKPVTLIITIESKEELLNLYHRTYIVDSAIERLLKNRDGFESDYKFYYVTNPGPLWNELYEIIEEKNNAGEIDDYFIGKE